MYVCIYKYINFKLINILILLILQKLRQCNKNLTKSQTKINTAIDTN